MSTIPTIEELWMRSLELYFQGFKLIAQGVMCFARIFAIHVRFAGIVFADKVLAASEWIDKWEPVRMR